MNAKPSALDAYPACPEAIHVKLERLQQLADDHFARDPDTIHWGYVADLGRVEEGLARRARKNPTGKGWVFHLVGPQGLEPWTKGL